MSTDRIAGHVGWKITEADYGQPVPLVQDTVSICPADNLIHFQLFATEEKNGPAVAALGTWLTEEQAEQLAHELRACAVKARANTRFPGLFKKNWKR